ncbi:MAG: selenocysteine lyase, partial [Flavobacteriaceae bacterium]
LGIFSFYIEGVHYNLLVKLLNDRYGVQTRGGCSCAGTYGHYLLNVDRTTSKDIERRILEGCLLDRPGWVRMSIHPTMTNQEVYYICDAIEQVALNAEEWGKEYNYDPGRNAYIHTTLNNTGDGQGKDWFNL